MSVDKISNGSQTNPTTINGSLHLNGANDKLSTTNTKETNIESASKELTHWTIKDGWFSEENEEWPGQALRLRVKKILHVSQSKYQDILVFESTDFGNVLVLDGVVQVSERDEFAYQEMLTHLALMSHPNPKRVLVVGGGDGGVLREIVKHKSVEQAVLVEIDEQVIQVSKQYLPDMAKAFEHPKVKVNVGDGFKFLEMVAERAKKEKGKGCGIPNRPPDKEDGQNEEDDLAQFDETDLLPFDVIITDSSDPEGPAAQLFQSSFYQLLYNALTPDGIMSCQVSENQWLNLNLIRDLKKSCKTVFPVVEYSYTCVPTYTSGQLGIFVCAKKDNVNVKVPLRRWSKEEENALVGGEFLNKYYNAEMHSASFVLPTWAKKTLDV